MGTYNDSKFGKKISREVQLGIPDHVQRFGELSKVGKKCGKYNLAQKSVCCGTSEVADDSDIDHDGRMYFKFPCRTSTIPHRWKDMGLFLINNTMLPSWTNNKLTDMMKEHTYTQSINSNWADLG